MNPPSSSALTTVMSDNNGGQQGQQQGTNGERNMMNATAEQRLAAPSISIKCTNSALLSSSQIPLGYLGGGGLLLDGDEEEDTSANSNNKIPGNTFYGSLTRGPLSFLPGLHSGSSKTFASEELEEASLKIYRGDFLMAWSEQNAADQEDEEDKCGV